MEPHAPADGHTASENLRASWAAIEQLDEELAEKMKSMTRRYGYHLDPAMHPQSLDTSSFRAGGLDKPGSKAGPAGSSALARPAGVLGGGQSPGNRPGGKRSQSPY